MTSLSGAGESAVRGGAAAARAGGRGRSRGSLRSWWDGVRPARPAAADLALAGTMTVASAAYAIAVPAAPEYEPLDGLGLALATLPAVTLAWRRSGPLVPLAVCAATITANAMAGYPIGVVQWQPWIALYTCFAVGGARLRAVALGLAGAGVAGYLVFDRVEADVVTAVGIAMCPVTAVLTGDASRSRHAYAAAVQARLTAESREQALAAERLLLRERGRLARELHDSLGHSVNVMVLQAGVGRRVFTENPDFSREALGSVETVGRGALEELDRLLKVLAPDAPATEPPTASEPFGPASVTPESVPAPEELTGLLLAAVERIRATGREVTAAVDDVPLTAGAARALYRILQEALTNAVRHSSPGGRIDVLVTPVGNEAGLEVTNGGDLVPETVPGRGLVNMRERARLEGGRFEAGRSADGFRVRAWFPLAQGAGE